MNRARILFVDDEAAVLDGLADLLRKERKRWDMVFASGGAQGLDELGKAHFDVVVSDMRMPGMNGAEFLGRVKASYPGITRLVLSGHAEKETLMRAIPVAHQFLSKPCDGAVLRTAIERAHNLRTALSDRSIQAIVGAIEHLPSVPRMYTQLTEVAADPRRGIADLARVIQRDPAMSAKVLQMVNSSYFGNGRHVSSIVQAIGVLGLEFLKGLALTDAFAAPEGTSVPRFSIERLRVVSVMTAQLAKQMCTDPQRAEDAFTAALVHDIGEIILALGVPEAFGRVIEEAAASERPREVVEREQLGVTHAEVGAFLLGTWGLPFTIVEAVAFHTAPRTVVSGPRDVLVLVHAAAALIDEIQDGHARLDLEAIEQEGFTAELPRWRRLAEDCFRQGAV